MWGGEFERRRRSRAKSTRVPPPELSGSGCLGGVAGRRFGGNRTLEVHRPLLGAEDAGVGGPRDSPDRMTTLVENRQLLHGFRSCQPHLRLQVRAAASHLE